MNNVEKKMNKKAIQHKINRKNLGRKWAIDKKKNNYKETIIIERIYVKY